MQQADAQTTQQIFDILQKYEVKITLEEIKLVLFSINTILQLQLANMIYDNFSSQELASLQQNLTGQDQSAQQEYLKTQLMGKQKLQTSLQDYIQNRLAQIIEKTLASRLRNKSDQEKKEILQQINQALLQMMVKNIKGMIKKNKNKV